MEIKFVDNSLKVLTDFDKAIQNGLEAIGLEAEKQAKKFEVAVDTGRLRNSITWATKEREGYNFSYDYKENGVSKSITDQIGSGAKKGEVYIGSNVIYARSIEVGSMGHKAIHYLQQAVTVPKDKYKKLIEVALKTYK